MRIADLRNRVEFQISTKTQLADYSYEYEWDTEFTTWANIKVNGGLLYNKGTNAEPSTTHVITVREGNDQPINREMTILHDGTRYSIHRKLTTEHGRIKYWTLHCEQLDTEV